MPCFGDDYSRYHSEACKKLKAYRKKLEAAGCSYNKILDAVERKRRKLGL